MQRIKTVGVTDYTNQTPSQHFDRKKCLSSTHPKMRNSLSNVEKNRRCTSLMCEQSLCKVLNIKDVNFWSYKLHKLGTPKVLWTDIRTDGKNVLIQHPSKYEKIFIKCAQKVHVFNV